MDRSPPIRSKRGHLKVATHPAFRCRRRSSQQRSERDYSETSSPLSRVGSCPFGTVSRSPTRAHEKRRFQPVKAAESFCVLVAYTDPQKLLGVSKEPKAMRLAVQPNG